MGKLALASERKRLKKRTALKNNVIDKIKIIIGYIEEFKEFLNSMKDEKFQTFCTSFLDQKFRDLGVLDRKTSIFKRKLKKNDFVRRQVINLVLSRNLASSIKEAKRLIKNGKIYSRERQITDPRILLNKVDEQAILLQPKNAIVKKH